MSSTAIQDPIKHEMDTLISSNKAVVSTCSGSLLKAHTKKVFSKTYCPYCKKAKQIFEEVGFTPAVVELDKREDGTAIQKYLLETTKHRTVPNIFIDGKHIGGSDSLVQLKNLGKLDNLTK